MRKYVLAIALSMAAITLSPSAFATEGHAQSTTTFVSQADFKADQARQDKDIHDTYVLANTKYTEAAGKSLERRMDDNDAKISTVQGEVKQNRADITSTRDDLKSLDTQVNRQARAETDARIAADTVNADAISTETSDRKDADTKLQSGIDSNSALITTETADRKDADSKLSARVDTKVEQSAYDNDKATQSATDAGQNGAISTAQATAESAQQVAASNTGLIQKEASDRKDGDARLKTSIDVNSSLIATKADNTEMQQKFADTSTRIAETKAAQVKTDKVVADHSRTLANHESRIQDLEANTSANFKDLKRKIDDNKKSADAGIAGVAAMAAIPQVLESQTFNVGAGVGSRSDQQALAVGFSARASQSTVVKVAVAADTNSEWTVGAGVAVGW